MGNPATPGYSCNVKRLWWIVCFAACSGKGDPVQTNPVKSVTVSVPVSQLVVGASAQATAVLNDIGGFRVTDRLPVWSSVAPDIASVDANGRVTALQAGTGVVRATSGNVSGDASFVVVNPKAGSITISRDSATVFLPGGSVQLLATVKDAGGTVITNPTIFWQSTAPLIATVSAVGLVTPLAAGTSTVRASIDGQLATVTIVVRATPNANAPAITAFAPSSALRPGASVVLSGTNFAATVSGNAVVIDGVATTVTAATATQLTITVPSSFPCEPTHAVFVQVTVGGRVGAASASLQAATLRTLAPGQSIIVTNAAEVRCNELADASGRYVFTVYDAARTSITPSNPGQVQLQVRGAVPVASAVAAAPAAIALRTASAGAPPPSARVATDLGDDLRRLRAHEAAHADILRRNLENLRANAPAIRAAMTGPRLQNARTASALGTVGAITSLKVPNLDAANFCQSSVPMGARTAYVGQHAIILEDTATTYNGAPTLAGQMDSYFAAMGQEFDTVMWPLLTTNFGNPLAMDAGLSGTGKVVMVFTPKVNAMLFGTVLGFVVSCDFQTVAQQPSSNFGEFFYAVVPTRPDDSYSPFGTTRKDWMRLMRGTVIHEVKHVTAFAERLSRNLPLEEFSWEEGMARHAEELYARSGFYKTQPKADVSYAATLACDVHFTTPGPCMDRPLLMLRHFDGLYAFAGQTDFVSPLGRAFSGEQTFYATAWSLERWAADHFAASESQFLKDWTTSTSVGVPNFEARTGRPWEESMGEWSLAMYLDNRPGFVPENPRLKFPSYNLPDLWLGMCSDLGPCVNPNTGNQFYPVANPWTVHQAAFGNFLSTLSLVGGSFGLYELSGAPAGRQLIELKAQNGGDPPPVVRLAIVRLP